MVRSYKAGFLTGFFCALLGSLIIGGAWWSGTMLGEKNKKEKLERIEFERWKVHKAAEERLMQDEYLMMPPYSTGELGVDVEMGTPMSVEEISKRLDQINRTDTKK